MLKNNIRTFIITHSSKSRIYFRKVELSNKNIKIVGISSLIFCVALVGIGALGFSNYPTLAKSNTPSSSLVSTQMAGGSADRSAAIDYSRPENDELSINSGGPYTPEDSEAAESETEKELQVIQSSSDPAFLPTIWAHLGKINNEFGFRRNPFGGRTYEFHAGMDIDGERGDIVVATANGKVVKAGWQGGYGNMIEIDHGNGLTTRYGHLSKIEVNLGDDLSRGQMIALIGSTGRSTGPHLHYELRLNDRPINPRRFLPQEPTELKKS